MQRAEIDWDQKELKQHINEVKGEIAKLAVRREALERETHQHSPIIQKLSKYIGFGAAGKLEWVYFKLNFQQEELARLMLQAEARPNGIATLSSTVLASQTMRASETIQQKMERMVRENPPALEPHIRQVYQPLIEAEQPAVH